MRSYAREAHDRPMLPVAFSSISPRRLLRTNLLLQSLHASWCRSSEVLVPEIDAALLVTHSFLGAVLGDPVNTAVVRLIHKS